MGGKPDKDAVIEEEETVDQDDSVAHIDFLEIHFGSAGLGAGAVIMIIISALLIVCLFAVCFRTYHRYQRQQQERRQFKHQRFDDSPQRRRDPLYESPTRMQNLGRSTPVNTPTTGAPLHRTTSAFDVHHQPGHMSRSPYVPPSDRQHQEHYGHQEDERPPLTPK